MARLQVDVQAAAFDIGQLQRGLLGADTAQALQGAEGAIATFTGYVRRDNEKSAVDYLELEHYPGMTERSILQILEEAAQRWPLLAASVVHRVGRLQVGDAIVWVGVSSAHRAAAFNACEFIMDYLKTRAPLWKKEHGPGTEHWVDARASDTNRAQRWHK